MAPVNGVESKGEVAQRKGLSRLLSNVNEPSANLEWDGIVVSQFLSLQVGAVASLALSRCWRSWLSRIGREDFL
jgi:hypothetical protein